MSDLFRGNVFFVLVLVRMCLLENSSCNSLESMLVLCNVVRLKREVELIDDSVIKMIIEVKFGGVFLVFGIDF